VKAVGEYSVVGLHLSELMGKDKDEAIREFVTVLAQRTLAEKETMSVRGGEFQFADPNMRRLLGRKLFEQRTEQKMGNEIEVSTVIKKINEKIESHSTESPERVYRLIDGVVRGLEQGKFVDERTGETHAFDQYVARDVLIELLKYSSEEKFRPNLKKQVLPISIEGVEATLRAA